MRNNLCVTAILDYVTCQNQLNFVSSCSMATPCPQNDMHYNISFFQRRISMYESRAIGTTRAFSVELGKHIKRTEYSDVRILCKLESHPINLRHSLRHLNIFSVVAFITVLHWCGSHISTDYNSPLIRSEFMKMELSWKHTLYLPSVFRAANPKGRRI